MICLQNYTFSSNKRMFSKEKYLQIGKTFNMNVLNFRCQGLVKRFLFYDSSDVFVVCSVGVGATSSACFVCLVLSVFTVIGCFTPLSPRFIAFW